MAVRGSALMCAALLLAAVACAAAQPALVSGNGFVIEDGDSTPRYADRTLFDRVVDTETNAFRITNTNTEGGESLFVTSIAVSGPGFVLAEEADAEIRASFDSLFSVRFTATTGGTFDGSVLISYTSGAGAFTYTFAVRATVAQVNLVLANDEYTTSWAEVLTVPAAEGVLANDVSLQGVLAVAAVPTITGPAAFLSFDLATGAFSMNITEQLFNGDVTFQYTATNGFETLTADVLVVVTDADSAVQCQEDVVLEAPTGTDRSPVFYTVPTASFGAPVTQVSGPRNGDVLTYADSPYEVVYTAAGLEGVSPSQCSFTIEITIQPPSIACPPAQRFSVRNTCTYEAALPAPFVTGFQTTVTGALVGTGEPVALDGAVLPIGEYLVELTVEDSIGQVDTCEFRVEVVLEAEASQFDQLAGYIDADRDGHGGLVDEFGSDSVCVEGTRDPSDLDRLQLGRDELLSALRDDCDDANAAVYPGHNEICDGLDNNCNGRVDEGRDCRRTGDRPLVAQPVHIPTLASFAPIRTLPSYKYSVAEMEVVVSESTGVRLAAPLLALLAAAVAYIA